MKQEINRIALGSVDIYMIEFNGTSVADIPSNEIIETDANLIGRTKDGGEVTYTTDFYSTKSDDGKAARSEMTGDSATVSFGLITWNGDTITKIVPTASATITGTNRRTLIGGVANRDDKVYLVRAVHKDKVKGDVRYTIIGKNVSGFSAAYKPGQDNVVTPTITAEPFDDGRLVVLDEADVIGISVNKTASVAVGSTTTLTASVAAPSAQTVTWTSLDEDNATVTSGGVVTGVAAGTAVITASITVSGTTYSDSCTVTVTAT